MVVFLKTDRCDFASTKLSHTSAHSTRTPSHLSDAITAATHACQHCRELRGFCSRIVGILDDSDRKRNIWVSIDNSDDLDILRKPKLTSDVI